MGSLVQADHEAALNALEDGGLHGRAESLQTVVETIEGMLEKWPVPKVRDGRALQWRTDEEFGCAVRPLLLASLSLLNQAPKDPNMAIYVQSAVPGVWGRKMATTM